MYLIFQTPCSTRLSSVLFLFSFSSFYLSTMQFLLSTSVLAFAATALAAPSSLEARQSESTTWTYNCGTRRAPDNFKAFDLGGCNAQLSFNKDRYVAVQWNFDAIYADGSRVEHKPFRDFDNYGVSDTFYPYLGNNFITRLPGQSAFTAVHEFTNVCRDGRTPVAWVFRTSSANSACSASSYKFTTGQIRVVSGTRPPKVTGTAIRRLNQSGDFEVTWNAVSQAAAYSVIVEYPTGTDEVGNPYRNVRGERIQVSQFESEPM